MIIFFNLLTEVTLEKERHLRLALSLMGASRCAFWTAWIAQGVIFNALSSLTLCIVGAWCNFGVFSNCDFGVAFLLYFLFGCASAALAFFVSTLLSTSKSAQTTGYAVILLGFVFQAILSTAYGQLADLLYATGVPSWVGAVRWILALFWPAFSFVSLVQKT